MRINHNLPALRALHQLSMNNSKLDKSLERLSSGLRINHSSDDAAGLAITQKMDTQIRGLEQAKRNTMDGISLIQTAEGALNEVQAMLQRIRELSVQASNGTYDETDRNAIQNEVKQLQDEIERISDNIEFNERKLLNGEIDRRAFPDDETVAQIVSLSDSVKPGTYQVNVTTDATKATIKGGNGTYGSSTIDSANAGTISLNGEEVKIEVGDTAGTVFDKLRGLAEKVGANLIAYDNTTSNPKAFAFDTDTYLVFEMNEYGDDYKLDINTSNNTLLENLGLDISSATNPATSTPGKDVVATVTNTTGGFSTTATVSSTGEMITVRDVNGFEMKIEAQQGATGKSTDVKVLDAGPLDLQIGANEGQFMEIRIPNLSPKALGIDIINLSTADGAQLAIGIVDAAVNQISSIRAKLGAYQNRLEHTVNNLSVASENMTEAMSRIQDADMAFEMAQYTQRNIISQAGTSMLAQANQRPQSILQLLQG